MAEILYSELSYAVVGAAMEVHKVLGPGFLENVYEDDKIILELKAVSRTIDVHVAQAYHYLTATGMRLTILINFGAKSLQYQRIIR